MKKVELLAPAGNYEAMLGAFAAGADAVYLGGSAFGARAYADNFSDEEIIQGIHLAHLLGKKIYLTVNTLVKEKEFSALYDFLLPFYRNGLDGVIIQDLGVFHYVKEQFPLMELHISTQMTITGPEGARLLKEEGAVRIVPARELSLTEIKEIKEKTDIEIEAFIHGAMCYCYSGQCLFSSILGGRSGNRGRCAQPCRLPYKVSQGAEQYPLSMKDMCTLSLIPELIEAGIDSFKIEGRMKKPEYAAGVTALYRKYIDLYYNSPEDFTIKQSDYEYLKKLYIRSDIQEGYYHQHNGKSMITPGSPAYAGSDEALLTRIREKYLQKRIEIPVAMSAIFLKDKPAEITLTYQAVTVTVYGTIVQQAMRQPLSKEKIKEQLSKSGNTDFVATEINIHADGDIFMPVSALNQLRRDAYEALKKKFLSPYLRLEPERITGMTWDTVAGNEDGYADNAVPLHVLVSTEEQFYAAVEGKIKRIYVEGNLLVPSFLSKLEKVRSTFEGELYLAFPYVIRKRNQKMLQQLYDALQSQLFSGALIRNLEELSFLRQKRNRKPIVTDSNLYAFNNKAITFYQKDAQECYLPLELNKREWQKLALSKGDENALSLMIYGRIPMMITANCLKKTTGCCDQKEGYVTLTDRYHKEFPVYTNCSCCYNVIYNSVPLSLHKLFADAKDLKHLRACRLDFTTESGMECAKVIAYFRNLCYEYADPFYPDFTTGHFKRGVE